MTLLSAQLVADLLPEPLSHRFLNDPGRSIDSIQVANRFAEWFDHSGTPFFRDYTDHSAKHSVAVFQTAVEFIDEAAYPQISAEDIAILLLSCFCHDCGMHITDRQFSSLIQTTILP